MTNDRDIPTPETAPPHQETVGALTASIGIWSNLRDPMVAGAVAHAGFDWICVDEQHGNATPEVTARLIDSTDGAGVLRYVRVPWNRPELIGRALDNGADGVIVPMVQSAQEATEAARACRYPPQGGRSWGPRRLDYASAAPAIHETNSRIRCLVMVETPEAVGVVEAIASVPGVDGIFVGPFDLSIALGRDVDDLVADEAEESPLLRILRACRASGIVAGAYAGSPERAAALAARGFTMLAVAADTALISTAAKAVADQARQTLHPSKAATPGFA